MPKINTYTNNTSIEDNDKLLTYDTGAGATKLTLFSTIKDWMLARMAAVTSRTAGSSDDVLTVNNGTVGKSTMSSVAKNIVEDYSGTSLAGSSQSVKAAIDALDTAVDALDADMDTKASEADLNGLKDDLSEITEISETPHETTIYTPIHFEYIDNTDIQNGITLTESGNGTIRVQGTASNTSFFEIKTTDSKRLTFDYKAGKIYRLRGCPVNGSNETYRLDLREESANGTDILVTDTGDGALFKPNKNGTCFPFIRINSGTTVDNLFYFELAEQTTTISYLTAIDRSARNNTTDLEESVFATSGGYPHMTVAEFFTGGTYLDGQIYPPSSTTLTIHKQTGVNSYYVEVTESLDVFLDLSLNPITIILGKISSVTKTEQTSDGMIFTGSNPLRFRKEDNNLPTEGQRLHLEPTDILIISFFASNLPDDIYIFYGQKTDSQIDKTLFNNDVKLNSTQLKQVNDIFDGSVKITAQTLTETEKEQARTNIGITYDLTDDVKRALLNCFQKTLWIDEKGESYYNRLRDALYPDGYPDERVVYELKRNTDLSSLSIDTGQHAYTSDEDFTIIAKVTWIAPQGGFLLNSQSITGRVVGVRMQTDISDSGVQFTNQFNGGIANNGAGGKSIVYPKDANHEVTFIMRNNNKTMTIKTYVDGSLSYEDNRALSDKDNEWPLTYYIGKHLDGNNVPWGGVVDVFRIYNTALTDSEINSIIGLDS